MAEKENAHEVVFKIADQIDVMYERMMGISNIFLALKDAMINSGNDPDIYFDSFEYLSNELFSYRDDMEDLKSRAYTDLKKL